MLVLDLDETLIYATVNPLERPSDFQVGPYLVYKRPGVDAFLNTCFAWFQVAVWTSASPDYASDIVTALFPQAPMFVWASDRCTWTLDAETGEHCNAKNLRKIKQRGYDLEAVIVVDDSPEKHTRSYGNLVRVTAYLGMKPIRSFWCCSSTWMACALWRAYGRSKRGNGVHKPTYLCDSCD